MMTLRIFSSKTVMKWNLSYSVGFGRQDQYLCVHLCYKTKKILGILMNHICISLTTLKKKKILVIDYTNEKALISPPHLHFLFSVCPISILKLDCFLNKYFSPDFVLSA